MTNDDIRKDFQLFIIRVSTFVRISGFGIRVYRAPMSRPHRELWLAFVLLAALIGHARAQAPNDQFYPQSWHHQQIGSEQAWSINGGSRSVVVAVIDTGVDASHP